jgi:hypothetical protein
VIARRNRKRQTRSANRLRNLSIKRRPHRRNFTRRQIQALTCHHIATTEHNIRLPLGLKDALDTLYAEGQNSPKMMSVGLHCRLAGRPGRTAALARFLDYVQKRDRVWICRRLDIARHWHSHHPPQKIERDI